MRKTEFISLFMCLAQLLFVYSFLHGFFSVIISWTFSPSYNSHTFQVVAHSYDYHLTDFQNSAQENVNFLALFSCAWPLALPGQQLRLVCTSWSTVSHFLPEQPRCHSCLPPLSPDSAAFPLLLQLALLIFKGCSFAVNTLILKLHWRRFSCTNKLQY